MRHGFGVDETWFTYGRIMSQVCTHQSCHTHVMHQSCHTHVMHQSCHTHVMHQSCHTLVMHQSCHTHVMYQSHTHPILCANAGKYYSVFGRFGQKLCMSAKVTECARAARPFRHFPPPKKSLFCVMTSGFVWLRYPE